MALTSEKRQVLKQRKKGLLFSFQFIQPSMLRPTDRKQDFNDNDLRMKRNEKKSGKSSRFNAKEGRYSKKKKKTRKKQQAIVWI